MTQANAGTQPAAAGNSSFPATRWSLVVRAGKQGMSIDQVAVATILQRYTPAMRSHLVCRLRIDSDAADDLLQGFILSKVLEQNLIARADEARGKFRSFLVRALDHHVIDEMRRQRAQKRVGVHAVRELDAAETVADPAPLPQEQFDRAWARQVLDAAVCSMRAHCERTGQMVLWHVFHGRVLMPALDNTEPLDYRELVARFGLRSPSQAGNLMITAKRAFARHLQSVVAEYTTDAAEAEAEIRDLRRVLAGGRGTSRRP